MDGPDWLIRWVSVFLGGLVFTLTLKADPLSTAAYLIINQGLFISLFCYLLLPPTNSLVGLLRNSGAGLPLLLALSQLPVAGRVPAEILFRICVVMLALSLFLWSLRQLCEALLPNNPHLRNPLFLLAGLAIFAPVWLGPLVEILQPGDRSINSIISITPLTHFCVAAQYDYLRSEWFYQNSPLGSLPFSYPSLLSLAVVYLAIVISLQIIRWWVTGYRMDGMQPRRHSLTIS